MESRKGGRLLERQRNGYPAGVPCWVDTAQPDPEAAVDFYGALFGWQFEDRTPANSPGRYFVAQRRGRDVAGVGSQPERAAPTAMWNTYIAVDSADGAVAKARDSGGSVVMEPFDIADAGRMAVLADPSGAVFCVWEAQGHRGAQLVNEPGTWNFSELNTRDMQGATAFYGAVFGWQADRLELGGVDQAMWRLPGYGDHLAAIDPDIRRRHAEQGAPEGFTDCVAWMVPMTSGQSQDDVPPHWSVTFSVDDADAMAGRAAELGGKVMVPPFDAGPTRVAVLSDPQGAPFSVSRYQPASR